MSSGRSGNRNNTKIFLRKSGKDFGPFAVTEFESAVRKGRVPALSWIYVDERWCLLAEHSQLRMFHPDFSEAPREKPESPLNPNEFFKANEAEKTTLVNRSRAVAAKSESALSQEPLWFVVREKKKYGPYSGVDILAQLQQKQISGASFVWRPGFSTWKKLSQVEEFAPQTIKSWIQSADAVDVVVQRRFARAPYKVNVIAHDNRTLVEGESAVVGEGGLFLATEKLHYKTGARVKVHFYEGEIPSFNAVAEVVSISRLPQQPGLCLKFLSISDSDRKKVSKFVSERSSR